MNSSPPTRSHPPGPLSALLLALACAVTGWPAPAGDMRTHGLVLIDKRGGHVRFFDAATLTEKSAVKLDGPPHELALSADRRTAFVPLYGDGVYGANPRPDHRIVVFDLATAKVTDTLDVSPHRAPHGLHADAAGMLYVTCDLSRKLLVIDPQTRAIEAAIDTEGTGHWLAVLPDASKAYTANKNDKPFISVIDLKARKLTARVPAPHGTQGITVSPDGRRMLAADFGAPEIIVVDTATDTVTERVRIAGGARRAFRVAFSPDGSKVVTCNDGDGTINILDAADLHGLQQVVRVGRQPFGVAFAPDGKMALVSNHGDGTITVVDLAAARAVKTFTVGTGVETLAYY